MSEQLSKANPYHRGIFVVWDYTVSDLLPPLNLVPRKMLFKARVFRENDII